MTMYCAALVNPGFRTAGYGANSPEEALDRLRLYIIQEKEPLEAWNRKFNKKHEPWHIMITASDDRFVAMAWKGEFLIDVTGPTIEDVLEAADIAVLDTPLREATEYCSLCKEPWSTCLGRHGSKPCPCGSGKPRNRCDCPGGAPTEALIVRSIESEYDEGYQLGHIDASNDRPHRCVPRSGDYGCGYRKGYSEGQNAIGEALEAPDNDEDQFSDTPTIYEINLLRRYEGDAGHHERTCVAVGSGPTLEDALENLKHYVTNRHWYLDGNGDYSAKVLKNDSCIQTITGDSIHKELNGLNQYISVAESIEPLKESAPTIVGVKGLANASGNVTLPDGTPATILRNGLKSLQAAFTELKLRFGGNGIILQDMPLRRIFAVAKTEHAGSESRASKPNSVVEMLKPGTFFKTKNYQGSIFFVKKNGELYEITSGRSMGNVEKLAKYVKAESIETIEPDEQMIKIAKRLSESLETGKPLEEAKASGKFGHKRKDIKRGTYVIIRRTGAIGKVTKVWPSGVRERAVYMVRRVDRVPPGKKLGAQSMHFEEELMPTDPPPVTEGFKDWMLGLTIAGAGIGMTGCSNEAPNKPDAQAKTEKFQDYRERVSKLTPKQRADEWKKRIGKRQAQDEIKKTGHTKATSNKTTSDDAAGFLDEALEAPDNDEDRFGNDNFCISLGNGMSSFDPGYWGIHICGKRHEHSDLSEFRRKLQYLTFDELDRYLLSYGEQGGDRPRDFQVWCKTPTR